MPSMGVDTHLLNHNSVAELAAIDRMDEAAQKNINNTCKDADSNSTSRYLRYLRPLDGSDCVVPSLAFFMFLCFLCHYNSSLP